MPPQRLDLGIYDLPFLWDSEKRRILVGSATIHSMLCGGSILHYLRISTSATA
jgi:hypothetical protein